MEGKRIAIIDKDGNKLLDVVESSSTPGVFGIVALNPDGSEITGGGGGGSGDVTGPASSTDNAVARFDSTTGKLIQNSSVTVSDDGSVFAGGSAEPPSRSSTNRTSRLGKTGTSNTSSTLNRSNVGQNYYVASDGQFRRIAEGTAQRIDFDGDLGNEIALYTAASDVADSVITWVKKVTVPVTGDTVFSNAISASNLSGTNTGDQDLSSLATKSELGGYALNCDNQFAITDYTFDGTERRNSGYLVTTASNRTVNINADLFPTGWEVSICKGTDNTNTVTLDAQTGNNINGSQTFVLTQYNEVVTLLKDGADTWKIKSHYYPPSEIASPVVVSDQTGASLTLTGAEKNNTFYVFTTSGAKTVTADPDLFPVGFRVGFQNLFSSSVSIDSTSGNVINNGQVYSLSRGYQSVWLVKLQTNRWVVESDNFRYATEGEIILSDTTNNNATSARHGFLPKLENTGTKYLRDDGTWQTVGGGGGPSSILSYSQGGTVFSTTVNGFVMRRAGTLDTFGIDVTSLPTGSSITVDLKKNGTSVLSAPLSITTTESAKNGFYSVKTGDAGKATISTSAYSAGDVYSLVVVAGTTFPGANLNVEAIGTNS